MNLGAGPAVMGLPGMGSMGMGSVGMGNKGMPAMGSGIAQQPPPVVLTNSEGEKESGGKCKSTHRYDSARSRQAEGQPRSGCS
ncbi:hypothetical protein MRX96_053829 [Rhipicephalus microplus]